MIKCEVIKQFNFSRYEELKNIVRKSVEIKGKLLVGDTFECSKDIADYLLGNNPIKEVVVKIIEVEPKKEEPKAETTEVPTEPIIEVKKNKKKNKKNN